MSNEVRDNRLAEELEEMRRLTSECSLIRFETKDKDLPDQYVVKYHCRGLAQKDRVADFHMVNVYLSADYPRVPPIIRFKTPIFHPNFKAMLDDGQEIERLAGVVGGTQNLERLYHQNLKVRELFDAYICLDVLQENWSPAFTLYNICLELGAMIQYQRFNVNDPLNAEAAEWTKWAQTQPGLLPIDPRDLRDRLPSVPIKESDKATIRILKVEKV